MKRVAIIGCSGSGKSTLASQLGAILGHQIIHLDALFWKPNWIETPREEWISIQEKLVKQESWIIDGNYTDTLDIRLAAADTIIYLDYPRLLCMYRAVKRRVMYEGQVRSDMAAECPEKMDWHHIHWIWSYPSADRLVVLQKLERYRKEHTIITLRNPSETSRFLENLKTQNV